jgi:uncharacterized membrane protein YfcA
MMKGINMTLKQMALLKVAKLVAFSMIVGAVVGLSQIYIGVAATAGILVVLVLIYAGRMVYQMELDKLNSLEKLKNIK